MKDPENAIKYSQQAIVYDSKEALLTQEHGMLSIAGRSRTLNDDVKLVFYNQTRGLRLFTPINDETLVRKYVETLLRRTFGTPDAMKLAVRQTA